MIFLNTSYVQFSNSRNASSLARRGNKPTHFGFYGEQWKMVKSTEASLPSSV